MVKIYGDICEYMKGVDNAEFDAKQIIMEVCGFNQLEFMLAGEISSDLVRRIYELADRRIAGEPLQYILGYAEFMSLRFEVNRHTLIPRPDTEVLVEELIKRKPRSVLDIGTGSGAVGVSLAYYCGCDAVCCDNDSTALDTAKINAEKNGVGGKCVFKEADILTDEINGVYDCIVSNPPYIKTEEIKALQTEVRDFEPKAALDGGEDGLVFYRRITEIAPPHISSGGILAFEIGYDQAEAVSELMRRDFENIKVIKDLCGNDRVVIGTRRNAPA